MGKPQGRNNLAQNNIDDGLRNSQVYTKLVFKEITPKQKDRTNKISVNNGNQILPLYK